MSKTGVAADLKILIEQRHGINIYIDPPEHDPYECLYALVESAVMVANTMRSEQVSDEAVIFAISELARAVLENDVEARK